MNISKFARLFLLLFGLTMLSGCEASTDPNNQQYAELIIAKADLENAAPVDVVDDAQSTARNFYVVFDGSGSMDERPPQADTFKTKLEGAKWAMHKFVEGLPDDVNLGLYVFDKHGSREVLTLGPNHKAAFLEQVDAVSADNSTPLGASIETGVKALKTQYLRQLGYGEFRLVVVTDGHATDSINRGVKAAEANHFPIYTIGFGIGQTHQLRQYSRLYQDAENAEQLKQALDNAASELEAFPDQFSGKGPQ